MHSDSPLDRGLPLSDTYVVNVSGGLTSFEALRRTIEKFGKCNVAAVFADVGRVEVDGRTVCGEDDDLYRFLDETEELLDIKVNRIRSPKFTDIWDVFFKKRFLGNSISDPCSKYLKREVIRKWVKEHIASPILVLGFSWLEKERAERYAARVPNSYFPLLYPPYVTSEDISDWLETRGIAIPALYKRGFSHNNCGGFCVKMGLGQAHDLWSMDRERFLFAKEMENRFRSEINSDATIFRKDNVPITMEAMEKLFEDGYVPRTAQSYEGCGGRCMVPEEDEIDDQLDLFA